MWTLAHRTGGCIWFFGQGFGGGGGGGGGGFFVFSWGGVDPIEPPTKKSPKPRNPT